MSKKRYINGEYDTVEKDLETSIKTSENQFFKNELFLN